jgi:DNA modification methylase
LTAASLATLGRACAVWRQTGCAHKFALPRRHTGKWGLRDYGTAEWEGGDTECSHSSANPTAEHEANRQRALDKGYEGHGGWEGRAFRGDGKRECHCGARRIDRQIGLEPTIGEYVQTMVEVFRLVRDVLADDGTCWINLGDSYASQGERGNNNGQGASGLKNDGRDEDSRLRSNAVIKTAGMRLPTLAHGLKPKDLCGIPWRVAFALQQPYYTGRIKNELDRVWLAAMIEAEGCLFIHRRKEGQHNGQGYFRKNDSFGPGLEVANTSLAIVERCKELTGLGSICSQSPDQNNRRKQTIYRWNLRTVECRDVIREVYPYLIAKKQQARILCGCPPSGAEADAAHLALIGMHRGSPTDVDFPAPKSMHEPGWYLRQDVIWSKANPMPESVTDRCTKSHEYVFLLSKRATYYYDAAAIAEEASGRSCGNRTYKYDGVPGMETKQGVLAVADVEWQARNRRSVWTIATEPYPDAHFATFPTALVEPCILAGTSARGHCPACGKGWERVQERQHYGSKSGDGDPAVEGFTRNKLGGQKEWDSYVGPKTIGWQPSCACGLEPVSGVVLDPFMGSGTVAKVAQSLGRRWVGCELNQAYVAMQRQRAGQMGMELHA